MVGYPGKWPPRRMDDPLLACGLAAVMLQTIFCSPVNGASFSANGVTFSDEQGGLTLESVTGAGSMDDPFVLVERMTDSNGGTLTFRVQPEFGNRIGSAHTIGFALIKVVQNATDLPWTSFELELQSELGTPSGYGDGLSFGQGSKAGKPFSSDGFDQVTLEDEPYDRVHFDHGRIPIGGHVTFRFVISESLPLGATYLLQRPSKPVAENSTTPSKPHLVSNGLPSPHSRPFGNRS
jgi:hypothetical protein